MQEEMLFFIVMALSHHFHAVRKFICTGELLYDSFERASKINKHQNAYGINADSISNGTELPQTTNRRQ